MSSVLEHQPVDSLRWVTFMLGEERYGIDVRRVREVLRPRAVTPVPGAPPEVLGIINVRGNVVTVIDGRRRLGMEGRDPDEATRVAIVEARGENVGLQVDRVLEVRDIASEAISAPPLGSAEARRGATSGVYTSDEGLLVLLDLEALLG